MGKTKQPTVKEEPFPQKKPKIASNPLDYYHYHPSWRISKIQVIDPFGWHILYSTPHFSINYTGITPITLMIYTEDFFHFFYSKRRIFFMYHCMTVWTDWT